MVSDHLSNFSDEDDLEDDEEEMKTPMKKVSGAYTYTHIMTLFTHEGLNRLFNELERKWVVTPDWVNICS